MTNSQCVIFYKQALSLGTLIILLVLTPCAVALDYGDAPKDMSAIDADMDNAYPTLNIDNGARHIVDGKTYLGKKVHDDADGQPTMAADGDHDDGVTFPKFGTTDGLLLDRSNVIEVTVSVDGFLNGWIDINQDGDWDDDGEHLYKNEAMFKGNNELTFKPSITQPTGDTYMRFRFSSVAAASPEHSGLMPDGEVEDYRVAMALPEPEICRSGLLSGDFEGLPRAFSMEDVIPGWSIVASDPKAEQRNVSGFVSRNSIEIWPSGFLGVPAYEGDRFAEINAHVAGAMYQDMQTTPGAVVTYKFAHRGRGGDDTIDVLIGSPNNTISQTEGEGYTTGRSEWKTYGGTYVVPRGQYITRFSFEALRTGSGSNSVGNFIDVVEFGFECDEDYGDAPAAYGVPRHIVGPSFYMGESEPDAENKEQASTDADGDDIFGEDDEDGVFIPTLIKGESAKIIVKATGKDGYLQGWIDWNGDGDFDDTIEGVAEQIIINARDNKTSGSARSSDSDTEEGQITIDITVPSKVTEDNTYARFRWSDTKNLKSTGAARNGEVEDYVFVISQEKMSCTANDLTPGIHSMGALSINATDMTSDTLLYQGSFDNRNWTGDITAYSLKTDDSDGNVKSIVWRASNKINRQNRSVFTYNPELSADRGTTFDWDNLNDSQKTYLSYGGNVDLGKARLDWIKGSEINEGTTGPLRKRDSILGSIVHSNLNFRSRYTSFGYKRISGAEGSSYAPYLVSKRATKDTLFVGANDGMLHAFDAENGDELFAYLPNEVIASLANTTYPNYGCKDSGCLPHEYYVDGKSSLADAYFDSSWHTILLGTLGLGGKAIFALDVSDPASFSAKDVLWEISNTQSVDETTTFADHMGISTPEPAVVKMKNGRWAAIVSNGYGSANHQAVLFIIDIETGELLKSINTGVGSVDQRNGLSSPAPVDTDGDYIADIIYAGDLQGNLWAFDISSSDEDSWKSKYGASPLFRACPSNSCATPQKITAKPQVGRNPTGGQMIYFGTGKYLDIGDDSFENASIESFYGIHDNGQKITLGDLVEQKILQEITNDIADLKSRVTSINEVLYPDKKGWFMKLLAPSGYSAKGERVISQAILRENRLIFVTAIPPRDECVWDGESWVMELNAINGNRLNVIPIDLNNDKLFTDADNVDYEGSNTIISGVQKPSLGLFLESPAIIGHTTESEGKYVTGSGGDSVGMYRESNSRFSGRMSWKKLK